MPETVAKSYFVDKTQSQSAPRFRSKLPLSRSVATTLRFGEVTPFYALETINNDNLPFGSKHHLRSFNLKSPLMRNLRSHKEYYNVPMEAILPLNWQKVYVNPTIGSDVVASDVNCCMPIPIMHALDGYFASHADDTFQGSDAAEFLNRLFFDELFFSNSSLLSLFNINCWPLGVYKCKIDGKDYGPVVFDTLVDHCLSAIRAEIINNLSPVNDTLVVKYFALDSTLTDGYSVKTKSFSPLFGSKDDYSFIEDFFNFCRENVLSEVLIGSTPLFSSLFKITEFSFIGNSFNEIDVLNIAPICAYQLCMAHYFTNDHVDYIYTAELYREMMRSLLVQGDDTFEYNGVNYLYDALSGHHINNQFGFALLNLENITSGSVEPSAVLAGVKAVCYIQNLFRIKRSLRFADYFTGSRLSPLAVGNTDINVSDNRVSVIDISKNIQKQRFLTLINRTGRRFEDYVSKLTGRKVNYDYHNPSHLVRIDDTVVSYETENTASEQFSQSNSITSNFSSRGDNYRFSFDSDRPSVIIGVIWFDIERNYCRTIERSAFHIDRFDYYNPYMQFIGDQEIYLGECGFRVGLTSLKGQNFGYNVRHAEYKTSYNVASGGFVRDDVLPSWLFLADNNTVALPEHLSPDYIRSRVSELDKFYLQLPYESLSGRFHFIAIIDNFCDASRPMVANPNIL